MDMIFDTHAVTDFDTPFVIDPVTREISNEKLEKRVLIQGDHKSEKFTFEVPRFPEGRDLGLCNAIQVYYINVDANSKKQSTGVYTVTDMQVHEFSGDILTCSWEIHSPATTYAGSLSFMLRFAQLDGTEVKYSWSTKTFEGISIVESLDADAVFEREYVDIIEQWKSTVMEELNNHVDLAVKTNINVDQIEINKRNIEDLANTHNYNINKLATETDILKERMNTFTAMPEGSTAGDAELADIRVGEFGTQFSNAGEAVRTQFSSKPNRHEVIMRSVGKNLFNRYTVTSGYFLNGTETPVAHASSFYSDYIPVEGGASYAINTRDGGGRYICFYDAAYRSVEGGFPMESINDTHTFIAPSNARLMRVSSYTSVIPTLQIEKGTEVTEYEPYYEYGPVHTMEKEIASIEKDTLKKIPSKNLFDKNAITSGYYLGSGGELITNAQSFASDFMAVEGGSEYAISDNTGGGRYICFYDDKENPQIITGIAMVDIVNAGTNVIEVPAYANYMRISHFLRVVEDLQIEKGTEVTAYEPYYEYEPLYRLEKEFNERMAAVEGTAGIVDTEDYISNTNTEISAGGVIELSDFPARIKNGMAISFYGEFETFGSMKIGKGFYEYRGRWFEIDGTYITMYSYEDKATMGRRFEHGLSGNGYISVVIDHDGENCLVHINTSGGTFTTAFDGWFDGNGTPFVSATNAMTNVVFNATSRHLDDKVWLFGDSYFGRSDNRVMGQLMELIFTDTVLIDGLAGVGSSGSYYELMKCLKLGKPDILVWCVGMNDSTDSYGAYLNQVMEACESRGITLILTKIPTVPDRDKEAINAMVMNSGLRYVDWYRAVGTNADGKWYDGYLDADGVHPTELGAKALAMRLLVDVPEIMRQ